MTSSAPIPVEDILVPRLRDLPDTIITPHTVINPLMPEDVDEFNRALTETWDEMYQWVSWAQLPIETTAIKHMSESAKRLDEFRLRKSFFMVARHPDTNEIMSFVTLYNVANDAREMEAGYWTRKKYMGQGITTEAMAGLLKWAFEKVGARTITADHSEGNEASKRTLEKLGFDYTHTTDGTITMQDGRVYNELCYVITDKQRIPAVDVTYEHRL